MQLVLKSNKLIYHSDSKKISTNSSISSSEGDNLLKALFQFARSNDVENEIEFNIGDVNHNTLYLLILDDVLMMRFDLDGIEMNLKKKKLFNLSRFYKLNHLLQFLKLDMFDVLLVNKSISIIFYRTIL